MYVLNNWHKFALVFLIVAAYSIAANIYLTRSTVDKTEASLKQLGSQEVQPSLRESHFIENNGYALGWIGVGFMSFLIFLGDLKELAKMGKVAACMLMILSVSGCYRPFEPVKLEAISNTETAFLLPYVGDLKKQTSTDNEDFLKSKLVYAQQIKIPQQWVPHGYEYLGANGKWQDAAILIKVDTSPVTREWTADPNSGTSNKNEAIWVMTADQVEFSTGWSITARIVSKEDAVLFLHNYPSGSLKTVLDSEVRAKLQTTFGLEVTDLPMDTLRKAATPHIKNTVTEVTEFFKGRGITITNLGISGGFIYKDQSIIDMLVKVFNAEQEKNVAKAKNEAQEELNKTTLSIKKTEADGIKAVADAKLYELEKTQQNLEDYVMLKQLELQKELLTKWDGSFPNFFNGGGSNPNMLLQLPELKSERHKSKAATEQKDSDSVRQDPKPVKTGNGF